MNKERLMAELESTLRMVDIQITEVEAIAKSMDCDAEQVRNADGTFMLTNLLLCRSQLLSGMALIEDSFEENEVDEDEELEVQQYKATLDGLMNSVEPKQEPKIWMHTGTGDCLYSDEPDNLMLARGFIRPVGQVFTENAYPHLFARFGNTQVPRPFMGGRTFKMPTEADLTIKTRKDDAK